MRGLLARLDDRFAILTKGRRTAVQRHQALGAMVDWSFETLTDAEKTVWRRFAVFRGAFTINAADRSATTGPLTPSASSMCSIAWSRSRWSASRKVTATHAIACWKLCGYAANRLVESGEAECVRRRHAEFWLQNCAKVDDNWVDLPTPDWLVRHAGNMPDIRAALDWAFSSSGDPALGIRLTAASAPLWFKTLLLPELHSYLERAIALAPAHPDIDEAIVMRLEIALAHSLSSTP